MIWGVNFGALARAVIMNINQGIPPEIAAEFNSGLILGFILTVIIGLITREITDKQNLFFWGLSLVIPTVIGSTLYYMWSMSLEFYPVHVHYGVGPLGYLEGSLCGLWVIGMLIAFRDSQD